MTAADGGYATEIVVLRKQFSKYVSLPSGLLARFGETCTLETFSWCLHQRYFNFVELTRRRT